MRPYPNLSIKRNRVRRRVRWLVGCYRREPGWFWLPMLIIVGSICALAWWSTLDPVGLPDWSGACTFPR